MGKKLGFLLLTFTDMPFSAMGDVSKLAEDLGYERAYTTESLTDALACNMVMAQATSRIVVGSCVAIIYNRHPHVVAQGAAAISDMSGGRYILGLGLGHPPRVRAMEIEIGKPLGDMRAYLEKVRGVLEGKPVYPDLPVQTYQGEELTFRRAKQKVPLYIAAVGAKMTELGGELADGLMMYMIPLSRMPRMLAARDRGAEKGGRQGPDVEINVALHTFLTDDLAMAREKARETLTYWLALPAYNQSIRESGFEAEADRILAAFNENDQKRLRAGITDEIIDQFCLVGPADRCRDRLEAFRSAGVDVPLLMIDPAKPGETYQEAFERTLRELAPSG